jgi:DMSO/TMAO reductase YedYZ heme-binding membrane subunit
MPPERVRVVAWAFAAMVLLLGGVALVDGGSEGAVRRIVRATAQIGVALFCLTFSASSLRKFWRTPVSAWLLRNRRYLGLSFGSYHLLHLAALGLLAAAFPQPFLEELQAITLVGGGAAYAFLVAQMATSNDMSVRWLGQRRWTLLHTLGSWIIWGIFALTFLPRTLESAYYAPFAGLLVVAMALRVARRLNR